MIFSKINLFVFTVCMIGVVVKTDNTCTSPQFGKILSRKKRFLVFPDGSSFAVKRSFSKAILDNRPKGINLNVDCGIYYPLPGSKDPWNPAKLLYRLDLARTDGLSATKKPKSNPKVDKYVSSIENNVGVLNATYMDPNLYFPSKHNYNMLYDRKSYWNKNAYHSDRKKPSWNRFVNNHLNNNKGNGLHLGSYSNSMNIKNYPWKNRDYRERRQVYEHSEGLGQIFGIDMKACIMRAICEMNNDFLPPGKSFIQDIARIFFDLPTDHEYEDEYGNIAKEKNINCAKRFIFNCPYSPTEFLLHGVRFKELKTL